MSHLSGGLKRRKYDSEPTPHVSVLWGLGGGWLMRKQCKIIYPFPVNCSPCINLAFFLTEENQIATFPTADFLFPTVSIYKNKFFTQWL